VFKEINLLDFLNTCFSDSNVRAGNAHADVLIILSLIELALVYLEIALIKSR